MASTIFARGRADPPEVVSAPETTDRQRKSDLPRIVVLITCLVSASVAIALSKTVFSHLSVNNDEAVYLLQAKALAHGHLFPPVGHPAASFTPWLGVIHGDHYVLKYTPVVASFLAISLVLTGGYAAALACWAAAFVAATYLLGKETTGNRGTAATAAVLAAACPLIMVQTAMALPYLPFLVLIEIALWGLLTGCRRGRFPLFMISGICAGLAFAARSYDALLMLLPLVGWLLWRNDRRRRLIGGLLAGAALPAAGLLWFDQQATGSAFRLPFSLFESGDTLGFGIHRLYPEEPARHFGLAQGWEGLWRHLSLMGGGWAFGGVLLLALVVFALIRRRVPAACVVILVGALLLAFGYLFFWGIWNAAIIWGAIEYIGPYYLMPLLVPFSIIGAIGLREIAGISRWKAIAVVVVASVVSGFTLVPALTNNSALNADNAELASTVAATGKSLVFVNTYPSYLQHPTAVISNDSPVGGRTVYALDRGAADFQVLKAYPDRSLYALQLLGEYGKKPHTFFGARFQRLQLVTGPAVGVSVTARVSASAASARLEVSVGGNEKSAALPTGQTTPVQLEFSAGTPQDVAPGARVFPELQPASGSITLTLFTSRVAGGRESASRLVIPFTRSASGTLTLLAPTGPTTELGPLPAPPLTVTTAQSLPAS
jgi:4-amino-4-deoxy-L-arabinose transferase-like glycosyltransferase